MVEKFIHRPFYSYVATFLLLASCSGSLDKDDISSKSQSKDNNFIILQDPVYKNSLTLLSVQTNDNQIQRSIFTNLAFEFSSEQEAEFDISMYDFKTKQKLEEVTIKFQKKSQKVYEVNISPKKSARIPDANYQIKVKAKTPSSEPRSLGEILLSEVNVRTHQRRGDFDGNDRIDEDDLDEYSKLLSDNATKSLNSVMDLNDDNKIDSLDLKSLQGLINNARKEDTLGLNLPGPNTPTKNSCTKADTVTSYETFGYEFAKYQAYECDTNTYRAYEHCGSQDLSSYNNGKLIVSKFFSYTPSQLKYIIDLTGEIRKDDDLKKIFYNKDSPDIPTNSSDAPNDLKIVDTNDPLDICKNFVLYQDAMYYQTYDLNKGNVLRLPDTSRLMSHKLNKRFDNSYGTEKFLRCDYLQQACSETKTKSIRDLKLQFVGYKETNTYDTWKDCKVDSPVSETPFDIVSPRIIEDLESGRQKLTQAIPADNWIVEFQLDSKGIDQNSLTILDGPNTFFKFEIIPQEQSEPKSGFNSSDISCTARVTFNGQTESYAFDPYICRNSKIVLAYSDNGLYFQTNGSTHSSSAFNYNYLMGRFYLGNTLIPENESVADGRSTFFWKKPSSSSGLPLKLMFEGRTYQNKFMVKRQESVSKSSYKNCQNINSEAWKATPRFAMKKAKTNLGEIKGIIDQSSNYNLKEVNDELNSLEEFKDSWDDYTVGLNTMPETSTSFLNISQGRINGHWFNDTYNTIKNKIGSDKQNKLYLPNFMLPGGAPTGELTWKTTISELNGTKLNINLDVLMTFIGVYQTADPTNEYDYVVLRKFGDLTVWGDAFWINGDFYLKPSFMHPSSSFIEPGSVSIRFSYKKEVEKWNSIDPPDITFTSKDFEKAGNDQLQPLFPYSANPTIERTSILHVLKGVSSTSEPVSVGSPALKVKIKKMTDELKISELEFTIGAKK